MVRWSLALLTVVAAAAILGTAAAAGGGCHSQDTSTSQARGIGVDISACKFNPVVLYAPAGATVTWAQRDAVPHNVVGIGWGDGSTFVNNGSSVQHTFASAGIYPYHCTLHPDMSGVVIVGDVDQSGAKAPAQVRAADPSALVAGAATERPSIDAGAIAAGLASAAVALGLAFAIGRRSRRI